MPNFALADSPIENPGAYRPEIQEGSEIVAAKAGAVFDVINVVGIVVAVIVVLIIGIKYMLGSVSEKAEYKKTMIPYLVGAFMLASITTILRIFAGMVNDITSAI